MLKTISAYSGLLQNVAMLALACMLVTSAIGIAFAWTGPLLHKTTYGAARFAAVLMKLERGIDGSATKIPVPGAEFYLYRAGAAQSSPAEQVGGRLVSDAMGRVYPPALAPGEYYFLESSPSPGYAYDTDGTGEEVRMYPFTVGPYDGQADPLTVTAYNKRGIGGLTIEKTVQNADGRELTDEQRGQEFSFTVEFGDGGEYEYSINGGNPQPLQSGGEIKLCHGDQAVFPALPTGLWYTVTEAAVANAEQPDPGIAGNEMADAASGDSGVAADSETSAPAVSEDASAAPPHQTGTDRAVAPMSMDGYWNIQSSNHAGNITEGGITAKFTNTWNDNGDTHDNTYITVRKTVTGEPPPSDIDREFRFTLTVDGTPTRFALKNGEDKRFTLPVGAVYEVREDDCSADGYRGSITNGYGTAGEQPIDAVQTNEYFGRVTVDITGEKTWDMKGHDSKLPAAITVRLKSGGRFVESKIVMPDAAGRWLYTFADLPKYEADGVTKAEYTVDELPLIGWMPTYNGFNIRNTYDKGVVGGSKDTDEPPVLPNPDRLAEVSDKLTPTAPTGQGGTGAEGAQGTGGAIGQPGTGRAPGTGDGSSPALWMTLLAASAIGLIALGRRKRGKGQ
jgi:hypothetical protein